MDTISYKRDVNGIDWQGLKALLVADDFDNGRTAEQLQRSFANSFAVCFAVVDDRVVGKARVLSDGVCYAYMVDVSTHLPYRHQGIATEMIRRLFHDLPGQHVYLQADDDVRPLYEQLGFRAQPNGLSLVVGRWLHADT
jgi:predicted GNAT family acetyltransferase